MQKVYIVRVLGWGDNETAWENISAHSTRERAEDAMHTLIADAHVDGLPDVDADIEVMSLDI